MEKAIFIPWKKGKEHNSEIDYVRKAIKGDEDAFVEAMKVHKVSLYKVAFSYVKEEQKALDILHECTYKGLLAVTKLKNPEFFKTWITRILINTAINYTKKDSKTVYLDDDSGLVFKDESLPVEEKIDLYNAIDNLRDKYKTVIILKYFENMSIDQISNIMDIPSNTVKSHLRRAKEALGESLREDYLNE